MMDVSLQRLAPGWNDGVSPHTVDQRRRRNCSSGCSHEQCQNKTLLTPAEFELLPVYRDGQRPEDLDLHSWNIVIGAHRRRTMHQAG